MGTFRIKTGNGDEVVYTNKSLHKQMKQRSIRNSLLAQSDSMIVSDRGLTDAKKTEWVTYRQSLRNMDFSNPDNITWPSKPE
tara:strand:+ start:773 stop:1018 length:246 start_codon:yes stop_codon:yes gene_type:complete